MSIFDFLHGGKIKDQQIEELRAQLLEADLTNDRLRVTLEALQDFEAQTAYDAGELKKKYDKLDADYELRRKDINIITRLSKDVYKAIVLFLFELDGGGGSGYNESRFKDRRQDLTIALRAQGWSAEEVVQILTEYEKKYGIEKEIQF